jgi:hypothetical protein
LSRSRFRGVLNLQMKNADKTNSAVPNCWAKERIKLAGSDPVFPCFSETQMQQRPRRQLIWKLAICISRFSCRKLHSNGLKYRQLILGGSLARLEQLLCAKKKPPRLLNLGGAFCPNWVDGTQGCYWGALSAAFCFTRAFTLALFASLEASHLFLLVRS